MPIPSRISPRPRIFCPAEGDHSTWKGRREEVDRRGVGQRHRRFRYGVKRPTLCQKEQIGDRRVQHEGIQARDPTPMSPHPPQVWARRSAARSGEAAASSRPATATLSKTWRRARAARPHYHSSRQNGVELIRLPDRHITWSSAINGMVSPSPASAVRKCPATVRRCRSIHEWPQPVSVLPPRQGNRAAPECDLVFGKAQVAVLSDALKACAGCAE